MLVAKVNGKIVTLKHQLLNGDEVEIMTHNNQKPNSDWLNYVSSNKAKSKIKRALNSQSKMCGMILKGSLNW